ncbi:Putative type II secretion system protein F [Rosistilla carotiformis]|uniref:Type II secretion system protein F n=1 Tax=Rosistilla carotiformis TaxID=2528017 RepID=A0A518JTF1_9BACT|nr:type II secretion system F family protein [Rosistilla carotiformis]QDV68817.1 Putative type II secretion system protein F [Rosistilla carotiformis]
MAEFAYTARSTDGQRVTGTLTAGSEREVSAQLAGRNLFPVEVKEVKEQSAMQLLGGNGRVNGQTMAIFYAQLGSLLRSGVPMIRSLTLLSEQASNKTLKEVLQDIKSRVEDGEPLGEALARYPRVFSSMGINMVRAGMEGGFLEDALDRVGEFTELQEDLKGRTVSALAYPIFLSVVGTVVVTILLVFFVPKFGELFARLEAKGQLPLATTTLLAFSELLQSYGLFLLAAVVAGVFFLKVQLATEPGQLLADRIKIKLPIVGGILLSLAVARFCRVLGTLLTNGVPILRSLEISRAAAGNRVLGIAVADAAESVQSGETLSSPLAASGHFPATVTEMIRVAEESNTLDNVLIQIADGLEKRTFRRLDLFVRLLEPVMLLVLAGVVLFVVMALLLPVIKSSSAL